MLRISCFFGGTIAPTTITGGDRHALEVWSAWSKRPYCRTQVFASFWGAQMVGNFGYHVPVVLTEQRPSPIGTHRLGYAKRCIRAIRAALATQPANIIYAASAYFYDLLPAIVLKLRSPHSRLIVSVFHLIPPPWQRGGSVLVNTLAWTEQRLMLIFVRLFCDRVIVDNVDLVRDVHALGVPQEHIFNSPMGVREIASAPGSHDRFDAIYVGRLAPPKGVPGLIDAWKRVTVALPHARLALVGNNEVGYDAREAVHRAQLDGNISIFTGLSDEAVRGMLAASRMFITGSLEEGYGISVLEALAAGLPCVTFDIPAFRHAFPVGRYPAAKNTYDALADAAIEVLRNPVLREELQRAIRERAKIRTWPEIAAQIWEHCVVE